MGNVEPIGEILFPYTSKSSMPLGSHRSAGFGAGLGDAAPAAAVVAAFVQLDTKLEHVAASVSHLAAACGVAGAAGAAPPATQPMWAATCSAAAADDAAGPSAKAAPSSTAPAGKQAKEERAFPTLTKLGSMVGLAKFYFKEPLPQRFTALDGVGPTDEAGQPWTPALMDKAHKDKWRGGRQSRSGFQRWYELLHLVKHLEERRLQLSNAEGRIVEVEYAAQQMDNERGSMNLNKYREVLNKGKSSGGSEKEADGASEAATEEGLEP